MENGRTVKVIRRGDGAPLVETARWCSSRLCRLRGLQFHRPLRAGEGIILVKPTDTIGGSSIHMFFVSFPIAAIWINGRGEVTSAQLAQPWRPYYASPAPARYVLETTPDVLQKIHAGDVVDFI